MMMYIQYSLALLFALKGFFYCSEQAGKVFKTEFQGVRKANVQKYSAFKMKCNLSAAFVLLILGIAWEHMNALQIFCADVMVMGLFWLISSIGKHYFTRKQVV